MLFRRAPTLDERIKQQLAAKDTLMQKLRDTPNAKKIDIETALNQLNALLRTLFELSKQNNISTEDKVSCYRAISNVYIAMVDILLACDDYDKSQACFKNAINALSAAQEINGTNSNRSTQSYNKSSTSDDSDVDGIQLFALKTKYLPKLDSLRRKEPTHTFKNK